MIEIEFNVTIICIPSLQQQQQKLHVHTSLEIPLAASQYSPINLKICSSYCAICHSSLHFQNFLHYIPNGEYSGTDQSLRTTDNG